MTTHTKLDIASKQLEMAIGLYVSGRDKISAITLAGAADGILFQLLLDAGKENFADHMRKAEAETTGILATRGEAGRQMNDVLNINDCKHMDPGDADYVDIDVDGAALGAILKACSNHFELLGKRESFVEAFLYWVRENVDPSRLTSSRPSASKDRL
jgi:hypothetical protein